MIILTRDMPLDTYLYPVLESHHWSVSHLSSPSKQLYPSIILRDMQGVQDFLKRPIRETVYSKEILHGDAKYPRILYAGVPRIGDAIIFCDTGCAQWKILRTPLKKEMIVLEYKPGR